MNGPSRLSARLKMLLLACASLGLVSSASAAWYWPFDLDPDSTNKPPRLHRLMEKANDYIELAEDCALEGDGDKAIENYRLALAELDKVEDEHPERAETPEFAPLRNKRATCSAAIDAIRFAQINENVRAVSLTNTKALEKKWRRKHGLLTPEDEEEDRLEEARKKAEKKDAEGTPSEGKSSEKKGEEKSGGATSTPAATTSEPAGAFEERRARALADIRKGDYAAAERVLTELQTAHPRDLGTLLYLAASQMGLGRDHAARRTLERAVEAHPKSYLPLYNLAGLSLKLGDPVPEARVFYEKGRALGGPRNEALEERLK